MTELGTVLDGKYEILKKVGQGGMSIVYLAMDNRLNKQWAVKEIKNDGSKSTATLLKGLEREANILKDVDHPVLPRIVDIINENGTIYVVMDFVEGRPLSDVLKAEGAQPQEKVIEWGRALASALDYLHSMNPPIIYRDMKPSNVMLKPDGSVKLIDFGTAKEYIVENNADTTALGTRGYAAPEQFGDAQGHGIYNTDARTDIYNLGATLYHLVTGKNPCEPPYEIKPIRQWNPMLSSGFERIIQTCCQPSPEDRYQSCSELLYALDHYNELDDAYKAKAKHKIAAFSVVAGLSILSACCAVIGGVKKGQLKDLDYNNKVNEARDAVDEGDYNKAFECYKAAVDIDPTASDAYIGYLLPLKGMASMHCSANTNEKGETAIFFGLSGTGKTTLSTDPKRQLIGDDEHGWDDDGVFNFEGGCYAKVINLSQENEPDIWNAIRRNALLENVTVDKKGKIDYADKSVTENTRVSYPIFHIENIVKPVSKAPAAKKVIFLSADAFGVLPPVSILTPEQTKYYFLSGFTAKLAGTERGITEPTPTFSACFGAAFLSLHPTKYGEELVKKMQKSGAKAYLVNTGWNGTGKRISIKDTRGIIDAILDGSIDKAPTKTMPIFDFVVPTALPGVDPAILDPRDTYKSAKDWEVKAEDLANRFVKNFVKFTGNEEGKKLVTAGPKVK